MATIRREASLDVSTDEAWAALREFGKAADLFAGVLVACHRTDDIRRVTFANGLDVRERLVTLDDQDHRLVYTVLDGPFSQHSVSMQLVSAPGGSRFIWISDFLPDDVADRVLPLVEAGCAAIKRNLERPLLQPGVQPIR